MRNDAIVALITGPPPSGVAVLRVSGHGAWAVGRKVFPSLPDPVISHSATYGTFVTGDDGLVLPFAERRSFTGEESIEFSIHGSAASVASLLDACINAGCRQAEPGEFTLRAFMNGRIDLSQAEGVRATVDAVTSAQLKQANDLRSGHASRNATEISQGLLTLLTAVEASTDFSEEIGDLDRDLARARLQAARAQIEQTLAAAPAQQILHRGLTIVIAGQPNAGKSSLLNQLLGADRAIVTAHAGTTRDTIEGMTEFQGVPCRLVDTAGIRESSDAVEQEGIARSHQALSSAHLVLYVFDAEAGWQLTDDQLASSLDAPTMIVANKIDRPHSAPRGIGVSCTTGTGIPALRQAIADQIPSVSAESPVTLERHAAAFQAAALAIDSAMQTLAAHMPDDLLAVDLRSALRHLGEISGETASPDVIDRIFHDFCIGK